MTDIAFRTPWRDQYRRYCIPGKRDVSSVLGLQGTNIEDTAMEPNVEEWMIIALYCHTAPEFRSAQKMFDAAYSGPEQRRRVRYRLDRHGDQKPLLASTRSDTALAA